MTQAQSAARDIALSIESRHDQPTRIRHSPQQRSDSNTTDELDETSSSNDDNNDDMSSIKPKKRFMFRVPFTSPRYRINHSHASSSRSPAGARLTSSSCASNTFWPGAHELRRVFRTFDRDGDGLISVGELRLGLAALGFDVTHLTNVARLSAEMDVDINGQIKESSFVRVFRKINRDKVIAELNASANESNEHEQMTSCVVVDIEQDHDESSDQLPRLRMYEKRLSPSYLASHLVPPTPSMSSSSTSTRKVRWIDCIGVHEATLSLLSNHYSLPPSCFDPALLSFDSTPHLIYSPEAIHDSDDDVLSVVLHAMSIVRPKRRRRRHDINLCRSRKQKHIDRELVVLPVHVIVLGDHTVITIHPLTSSSDESDIFQEFRSLLQASISQEVPLASPFVGTLHTSTAQSLAVELMDELTDWNWSMRDDLHQWKANIESRLSGRCKPALLDEIHNIQAISLQAQRSLAKMSSMFEHVVEEEDQYEMQQSRRRSSKRSKKTSTDEREPADRRITSDPWSDYDQHLDRTSLESRHIFFNNIRRDFNALSSNTIRLYADMKLAYELIQPLVGYYRQRRDEETNAILYLLTVLTALVTPLQISSSVYGMNFINMPELEYEHGYPIFWCINIVVMIGIAIMCRRKGWL